MENFVIVRQNRRFLPPGSTRADPRGTEWTTRELSDIIEIEQLLARYAVGMTKDDVESVMAVFTPDGTYRAFGDTYPLADFPTLVAAAPKGLFLVGTPAIDLDGDDGHRHASRCASSSRPPTTCASAATPTPTAAPTHGWRLRTRSMTFLRKSGARDAGRAHDPTRPQPTAS